MYISMDWQEDSAVPGSPLIDMFFFLFKKKQTPHPKKKIVKKGAEPKLLLGSRPATLLTQHSTHRSILLFHILPSALSVCVTSTSVAAYFVLSLFLPLVFLFSSLLLHFCRRHLYILSLACVCVCVDVLARRATWAEDSVFQLNASGDDPSATPETKKKK